MCKPLNRCSLNYIKLRHLVYSRKRVIQRSQVHFCPSEREQAKNVFTYPLNKLSNFSWNQLYPLCSSYVIFVSFTCTRQGKWLCPPLNQRPQNYAFITVDLRQIIVLFVLPACEVPHPHDLIYRPGYANGKYCNNSVNCTQFFNTTTQITEVKYFP